MPSPARLVIAGAAGDSGKTLVSLGLLLAWRQQGLRPAPFKKGPDYIDAAWLSWAADATCRNLDTYLQPAHRLLEAFSEHASADVSLVEGNRGLFDGVDEQGTHSTASLARLLGAPVVLVVNAAKVTRTVAALVLGCQQLEPRVHLAGVILNRVAGSRHETLLRRSVEAVGVGVLGALPRVEGTNPLPGRHLGLVTPQEHPAVEAIARGLCQLVRDHVDTDGLLALARADVPSWAKEPAPGSEQAEREATRPGPSPQKVEGAIRTRTGISWPIMGAEAPMWQGGRRAHTCQYVTDEQRSQMGWIDSQNGQVIPVRVPTASRPVRIGVFLDSAFTFYYPDNLEALQQAGAELVFISPLQGEALPAVHGLYLGGGFPETHAGRLSDNVSFLEQVRRAATSGLPIYAECGGLVFLSGGLLLGDGRYPMAGVLPLELELCARPQGHGYVDLIVDRANPFFEEKTLLRGHEFHYTRVIPGSCGRPEPRSEASAAALETAFKVRRGTGVGEGRDGVFVNNVLACYTHLHALGVPGWAPALVRQAACFAERCKGMFSANPL